MNNSNGTILFESRPAILSAAAVVGKKEGEGPLRDSFDRIVHDSYAGKDTFEQAESELMYTAVQIALEKCGLSPEDIGAAFCGDLLNQCVASSFAMRSFGIPYVGVYGACSTMALGLGLAAIAVESGGASYAMCAASSHYCTAERQYRFPLEYGSQRPPTAQWTVTGSGACIIGSFSNSHQNHANSVETTPIPADAPIRPDAPSIPKAPNHPNSSNHPDAPNHPDPLTPYINAFRIGKIVDYNITDQNNMGAAMAPAVVKIGTNLNLSIMA